MSGVCGEDEAATVADFPKGCSVFQWTISQRDRER